MASSGDRAWIVAAAYAAVGIEAFLASRTSRPARERSFWAITAALLLFFGAAKQVRLEGTFSDGLRGLAREHGLYASRHVFQYSLVLILVVGATFLLLPLRRALKDAKPNVAMAAAALSALTVFLLLRAVSVHALDLAMTRMIAGLPSGWWVEILALTAITLAAAAVFRAH